MGGLGRWIQGKFKFGDDLWMATSPKLHKETLSEGNYRLFIGFALDVLLKPWERFVMALKFTEVCPLISTTVSIILTSYLAWCREV